jgi:predicted nucleotide-binding protein
MRLVDTNDPEQRRKAAIHYAKIARQAQRQLKRRNAWINFTQTPHFAFVDMILCALLSAIASVAFAYLLLR